ncbi:Hypp7225 [Branchiostoma lanceolatum]|uniref:Hypp7225 protein n=1 Tax=Branchiostoma lanceolatum TaxID=7740 RepID=A0A8J9YYI4_BRALA|nr:Hypp7225 [Branchiostoma lanceolatum]
MPNLLPLLELKRNSITTVDVTSRELSPNHNRTNTLYGGFHSKKQLECLDLIHNQIQDLTFSVKPVRFIATSTLRTAVTLSVKPDRSIAANTANTVHQLFYSRDRTMTTISGRVQYIIRSSW